MNANDAVSEAMDLTQLKTKFEGYLDNGEFLPLGAWVVRGYDPELIVANAGPDDIRETKMAGKCYRVGVVSTSSGTTRQQVESHNVRLNARPKGKALAGPPRAEALDDGGPLLALEDGDADVDSTSSNSSSSSSSERHKKRAKKDKKHSKKKSGKKDKKHGKDKKDKKKGKKHGKTPKEDMYGLPHLCQSSATESLI